MSKYSFSKPANTILASVATTSPQIDPVTLSTPEITPSAPVDTSTGGPILGAKLVFNSLPSTSALDPPPPEAGEVAEPATLKPVLDAKPRLQLTEPNVRLLNYTVEGEVVKRYGICVSAEGVPVAITRIKGRTKPAVDATSVPDVPVEKSIVEFSNKAQHKKIQEWIALLGKSFVECGGKACKSHMELLEHAKLVHHSKRNDRHSHLKIPYTIYREIVNYLLNPDNPEYRNPTTHLDDVQNGIIVPPLKRQSAAPRAPAAKRSRLDDAPHSPAADAAGDDEESSTSEDDDNLALAKQTASAVFTSNKFVVPRTAPMFIPDETIANAEPMPSAFSLSAPAPLLHIAGTAPAGAREQLAAFFGVDVRAVAAQYQNHTVGMAVAIARVAEQMKKKLASEEQVYALAGIIVELGC